MALIPTPRKALTHVTAYNVYPKLFTAYSTVCSSTKAWGNLKGAVWHYKVFHLIPWWEHCTYQQQLRKSAFQSPDCDSNSRKSPNTLKLYIYEASLHFTPLILSAKMHSPRQVSVVTAIFHLLSANYENKLWSFSDFTVVHNKERRHH